LSSPEQNAASRGFFADLPAFPDFLQLTDPSCYRPAPDEWLVVVTDVVDSTTAIESGRYADVNVIGGASIAAVLNACGRRPLPYAFGGDGATLLVPPEHRREVAGALNELVRVAREVFDLEVRIGAVPVEDLRERGHEVLVGRHALSEHVSLALFAGEGLEAAARLVKAPDTAAAYTMAHPDARPPGSQPFEGLHCRWKPIPSRHGEMVSLLVRATPPHTDAQLEIYGEVVAKLEELAAGRDLRPLSESTAQLADRAEDLDREARLQLGQREGWRVRALRARLALINRVGSALMERGMRLGSFDGATYRRAVVRQSDFRKLDGMLRMVVDLTPGARAELEDFLEERHHDGELVYGFHTTSHALMTCLIWDREREHVHFIDGAGGGYTRAALDMRSRLSGKRPRDH
jgi:hypothetical protein